MKKTQFTIRAEGTPDIEKFLELLLKCSGEMLGIDTEIVSIERKDPKTDPRLFVMVQG